MKTEIHILNPRGCCEISSERKDLEITASNKKLENSSKQLWTEICNTIQELVIKTIPKKKKCKRQSGCLRSPYKYLSKEEKQKAKEKRKDIPI